MARRKPRHKGFVPRIKASVPATIYVNGTQIPPIESGATITRFACDSVQLRAGERLPILSKGVLRFELDGAVRGPVELNVEVVGCIPRNRGMLPWSGEPHFDTHLRLMDSAEDTGRYLKMMNGLIFGTKPVHYRPGDLDIGDDSAGYAE